MFYHCIVLEPIRDISTKTVLFYCKLSTSDCPHFYLFHGTLIRRGTCCTNSPEHPRYIPLIPTFRLRPRWTNSSCWSRATAASATSATPSTAPTRPASPTSQCTSQISHSLRRGRRISQRTWPSTPERWGFVCHCSVIAAIKHIFLNLFLGRQGHGERFFQQATQLRQDEDGKKCREELLHTYCTKQ